MTIGKTIIKKFPRCDAVYKASYHHCGDRCTADAPYSLHGKNYCKRHAKEAAFEYVFEGKGKINDQN